MTAPLPVADSFEEPARDELVNFTVLCQPASGISLEEFRRRVAISSLDGLLPADTTLVYVASQLQARGFEIVDIPGPVVFARGRVDQFEETFGGHLVRLTRQVSRDERRRNTMTEVVLRPGTDTLTAGEIEGALLVTVAEPPRLATPPTPQTGAKAVREFCLTLPAGVARTTMASSTHRRRTPTGDQATGRGVVVAVIDSGFACHPYFTKHPYQITRIAAPDTDSPDVDEFAHGTAVLANLLACAPDANVYAIKYGQMHWAFGLATAITNVRVISLSWGYDQPSALPGWMLILQFQIMFAVVEKGVTVIVASGDDIGETCPANRPEIISVGGVKVDAAAPLEAWDGTASFRSVFHPGRAAPDLCGVASQIRLPMPPPEKGRRYGWECADGGTSCAAPQVAGIAALLIQKNPALTPSGVRSALAGSGTDITIGQTFTQDVAHVGSDFATGGGLVNALQAWFLV